MSKASCGGRAAASLLPVAFLALAGCVPAVLDPAGPVGRGQKTILLNSVAIMLAIVVPVIVLTLVFAWWFRAGNARARRMPDWSYSGRLELLVWSIPLLVVIFLAGIAWIGSHRLAPDRPLAGSRPLQVQVVSLDWKWLFIYPEQGIATMNHLVIPAGTPIAFHVTSATVMNSFFVPQLGSQIYAMSGMDSRLYLQADAPGRYRGISAHYSGEGFADMHFVVDAVTPARFAQWAAGTRGHGPVLDGRSYLALARHKAAERPLAFGAVAPNLYEAALHEDGAPVHDTARDGREAL